MSSAEPWLPIRRLRSNPPGNAAGQHAQPLVGRRAVFSAALEQAEQLLRPPVRRTPASVPCCSSTESARPAEQSRRQLTKDPELNGKDRWQIVGHGLSCDDRKSRGLHPSNLAETQMVAAGGLKSGLRTMQRVLGSPAWKVDYPVELGEVFAALPTLPTFPGRDDWPAAQFEARLRPGGLRGQRPGQSSQARLVRQIAALVHNIASKETIFAICPQAS